MTDQPDESTKQPWTVCPECGRGRGEDHRRECSRGKQPSTSEMQRRRTEREVKSK